MVKLYGIVCLGTAAILFPGFILAYLLLIGLFIVAYLAKVLKTFSRFIIGFAIPILVMLLFIHGLYSPRNVTTLLDLGFAKLGLEGTVYAIKLVGCLLVFLGSFWLMTVTTHPGKLVTALVDSGMNSRIGYLILATIQIVPQMQRKVSVIQQAQTARGVEVEGNLFTRAAAFLPLIGPLVMGSLIDMQERSMTLETRAFGATGVKTTSYIEVIERPQEKLAQKLLVAFTATSALVSVLYWILR
jgi:energy-coupling factor transport system permease protein